MLRVKCPECSKTAMTYLDSDGTDIELRLKVHGPRKNWCVGSYRHVGKIVWAIGTERPILEGEATEEMEQELADALLAETQAR